MTLSPEIQKRIDELTADLTVEKLPLYVAAAILPIEKPVQEQLHHWYAEIPLALEHSGSPLAGLFVSIEGSMRRLTWHTAGDYPQLFEHLESYLDGIPIPPANMTELEKVLQASQPAQLGSWIEARTESFDLGWYLRPEDASLAKVLPYLPRSADFEQVVAWTRQYGVTECLRLGKSLASNQGLTEIYLPVSAPNPRRAVDVGLLLFRYLGLDHFADAVYTALLAQRQTELITSLQLGVGGLVKVGLMLPQPSLEMVQRLLEACIPGTMPDLTLFEECLEAGRPGFVELQHRDDAWTVELHYQVR